MTADIIGFPVRLIPVPVTIRDESADVLILPVVRIEARDHVMPLARVTEREITPKPEA